MQVAAVMAQIVTLISLSFLVFVAKTFIQKVDSQAEENWAPTTTYDEWYQSGMDAYNKENWEDTIYYLEKALEEFGFYRNSLVECRQKCGNVTHTPVLKDESALMEEMKYFQGLFRKADCVRKCKHEKLGNRPQLIDNDITDKFLGRMPYSYLQFAYYKSFEYEKAVAAAYTYVQWHQDDEVMQNNLEYYRNLHGITEEHLIDLEEKPHHKYFMEGYRAYEKGDFVAVIESIKTALEHYWRVDEECRALCEGKYENREFMDLYEAVSNHYASVLFCKSQCEEWNSRMKGGVVDNYLPNHFHYLQYAYHKEGQMQDAVNAAASFLLLVPDDPTMTSNMHYYEDEEGVNKYTVQALEAAVAYQNRKDLETRLLQFAKQRFWGPEDLEYLEEHYQETANTLLYQDQAEPINPDEVILGAELLKAFQSGHSFADHHGDDPSEVTTQPEEIWAEYLEDEEEEMGLDLDVEHFPEGYFEKPEEIWEEDEYLMIDEDEEDEGPMREYSPEPMITIDENGEQDSQTTGEHLRDLDERALDVKEQCSSVESLGEQGSRPSNSEATRDDFIDPNLGYHMDSDGIKWPNMDGKSDSGAASQKKRDTQDVSKETAERSSRTGKSEDDAQDVIGVSALDGLKKTLIEDNLLPSGPPHAGPSVQGRRYGGDLEEAEDVEPSYVPSLDGVKLFMNAGMLNGTNRMAADNVATQLECDNLMKLMDIESKMGDGYNGKVYPHTKFESFEGMTVSVAVKAAKVGRVPLILPATYMHLAEKSRIFMKKYYSIKSELYFSFSHLVCRKAEPDSTPSRTDLSHPIHADNCNLDEAHVCHKSPPAFTWRDWSAVLYLNSDFEGGEFVFAHPNFTFQSQLQPKCGRLVGFSAGEENLHGVKAVLSGRRCALALWFTEDPRYQEQEFNQATVTFRETWEEQEARKKQQSTAKTEL